MDRSTTLNLPYILPNQAQKHVTYNEAINVLDVLVQLVVVSTDIAEEPESPKDGDTYILPAEPTGTVWSGAWANSLMARRDGHWVNLVPQAGWRAWVKEEQMIVIFDGVVWRPLALGASNDGNPSAPISTSNLFGINTNADPVNRLSVKSDAVLISHDDVTPGSGDARLFLNKDTAEGTSSIIWQNGFSARAEFGLTGSDRVSLNVTPNGTVWQTALMIDQTSAYVGIGDTHPQSPLTVNGRTQSGSYSSTVSDEIAQDTAISLPTPAASGLAIIYAIGRSGRDDAFPNMGQAGAVWFDAGTSLQIFKAFGTSRFSISTTPVNGTTGSNGQTTIAVQNGQIQIENRSGNPYKYSVIFLV